MFFSPFFFSSMAASNQLQSLTIRTACLPAKALTPTDHTVNPRWYLGFRTILGRKDDLYSLELGTHKGHAALWRQTRGLGMGAQITVWVSESPPQACNHRSWHRSTRPRGRFSQHVRVGSQHQRPGTTQGFRVQCLTSQRAASNTPFALWQAKMWWRIVRRTGL